MTEEQLISLALRPRLNIPRRRRHASWEKQCLHCPQTVYDQCKALNLAGLPLRCEDVSDEDMEMLRRLADANAH